jgi:hypothetical protein
MRPPSGKTENCWSVFLLHDEQGFGDTIRSGSLHPLVARAGGGVVAVV